MAHRSLVGPRAQKEGRGNGTGETAPPSRVNREDYLIYVYVLMYTHALGTETVGTVTNHPLACAHEQPLVAPHVSHFRQVPLRTSVKLPHSLHASPS